jgi:2'-5' RNA ligase
MTRTFIALEMNTALQRHLTGFTRRVASTLPTLRWVDVEGIHLTLAFLGELDDAQLASAIEAVQAAAHSVHPFTYRLTRPGIFGSPRQPRVLWMGIEEKSGALQRLHRSLACELDARGFETEKRPFSPHLTLARGKAPLPAEEITALQRVLTEHMPHIDPTERYPVTCLQVMKSELQRTGAIYTCLHRADLT